LTFKHRKQRKISNTLTQALNGPTSPIAFTSQLSPLPLDRQAIQRNNTATMTKSIRDESGINITIDEEEEINKKIKR
tara:strand:+ start:318 stop:548 length:231 start_codon:yes stop_codon:yes gene_type:complete